MVGGVGEQQHSTLLEERDSSKAQHAGQQSCCEIADVAARCTSTPLTRGT